MNFSIKSALLGSLLVSVIGVAPAQDEPIVIEDLSRSELRAEIEKIENEVYRVFNASIDNERLKVECDMYTPTGSRIAQRVCEPRFLADARNENVQNWQNQVDELQSTEELRSGLQSEFQELTDAMNEVLQESEYFRGLNGVLRMLRERMQELNG